MSDKVNEIVEFLSMNSGDALSDCIMDDLKITGYSDMVTLYDPVEEKHFHVTLDDIIKSVINRVIEAVGTFEDKS